MKNIDWSKWLKVVAVGAVAAVGVPEVQAVLPPQAIPVIQGLLAAWALAHKYQPASEAPRETPKA